MAKKGLQPPVPKGAAEALDEDNPFGGAGTPAGQPVAATSTPVDPQVLMAQLTQLTKDAQAADRERAAAEAQLKQAQKDLKEIDDSLKSMGVDPETAPAALAQLEQELAGLAQRFEEQLAVEREAYRRITAALT